MNPARKRQTPPEGRSGGDMQKSPVGQELRPYSYGEGKASTTAKFAGRKFAWLEQVAGDPELPANCARIAIAIVHFWRDEAAGAWPAIGTLATQLGCSMNAIRRGIADLEKRGHLAVTRSVGGKGSTNAFKPALKPSHKWKGSEIEEEHGNPSISERNPSISSAKPSHKWKGTPSDTSDDSVRGRAFSAPLSGKGGDSDSRVAASSAASEVLSKTGDVFSFEGLEWTVSSPPKFDPARGLSAFFAKNPDGLETDLTIDADGCIDRDIPF